MQIHSFRFLGSDSVYLVRKQTKTPNVEVFHLLHVGPPAHAHACGCQHDTAKSSLGRIHATAHPDPLTADRKETGVQALISAKLLLYLLFVH